MGLSFLCVYVKGLCLQRHINIAHGASESERRTNSRKTAGKVVVFLHHSRTTGQLQHYSRTATAKRQKIRDAPQEDDPPSTWQVGFLTCRLRVQHAITQSLNTPNMKSCTFTP